MLNQIQRQPQNFQYGGHVFQGHFIHPSAQQHHSRFPSHLPIRPSHQKDYYPKHCLTCQVRPRPHHPVRPQPTPQPQPQPVQPDVQPVNPKPMPQPHPGPHLPHIPLPSKMTVAAAKDFIGGLIFGIIKEDHFDAIQQCLKDGETVAGQLTEAVGDFKKKDFPSVLMGIQVMGQVIEKLPEDLADCKMTKNDLQRIKVWSAIFKNPLALTKKIALNAVQHLAPIGADISSLAIDVQAKDYKNAGEVMADLLIQNLGPVPQLNADGTPILTQAQLQMNMQASQMNMQAPQMNMQAPQMNMQAPTFAILLI